MVYPLSVWFRSIVESREPMGRSFRGLVLAALLASGLAERAFAEPTASVSKPNVVVFYVDDMSWAQPGCYGGQLVPTPHMDELAQSDVRLLTLRTPPTR